MDDGNQVPCNEPDRPSKLYEPLAFLPPQEYPLLRNLLSEHLVLGFEEFNLTSGFMLGAGCQIKLERLEEPSRGDRILVEYQVRRGDELSAPCCLALVGTVPRSGAVCRQSASVAAR
jgi:hypothetical protein